MNKILSFLVLITLFFCSSNVFLNYFSHRRPESSGLSTYKHVNLTSQMNLFYFDALTDYDNLKSMNKITKEVLDLFHKDNLTYWIIGGTLLGSVRDQGPIPWDDDLDLCIMDSDLEKFFSLKNKIIEHDLKIFTEPFLFKLYYKDGKPVPNKEFNYPFIDVFIFHEINDSLVLKDIFTNKSANNGYFKQSFFRKKDVFPLKRYAYEDFYIYGPHNPYEFLNRTFINWTNIGSSNRHFKNRAIDKPKLFPIFYFNKSISKTFLWLTNQNEISIKNSSDLFHIIDLKTCNLKHYLPELDHFSFTDDKLKQIMISFMLLYKYGGIYVDTSKVKQISNFKYVINKLKKYEFVGFSYNLDCSDPTTALIASKPKRILIENVLKKLIVLSSSNSLNTTCYSSVLEQELINLKNLFGYEYYKFSKSDTKPENSHRYQYIINDKNDLILVKFFIRKLDWRFSVFYFY